MFTREGNAATKCTMRLAVSSVIIHKPHNVSTRMAYQRGTTRYYADERLPLRAGELMARGPAAVSFVRSHYDSDRNMRSVFARYGYCTL